MYPFSNDIYVPIWRYSTHLSHVAFPLAQWAVLSFVPRSICSFDWLKDYSARVCCQCHIWVNEWLLCSFRRAVSECAAYQRWEASTITMARGNYPDVRKRSIRGHHIYCR